MGSQTWPGGQSGFPIVVLGNAEADNAIKARASNRTVLFTVKLLVEVGLAP
jgi:hypothetical protein